MRAWLLLLVLGCETATQTTEDLRRPPDMAEANEDLSFERPDLFSADLPELPDLTFRDLVYVLPKADLSDLTDMLPCRTNGTMCDFPSQCCSNKCEAVGANPVKCCALVGQACGTGATGDCCNGLTCKSNGAGGFTCQ